MTEHLRPNPEMLRIIESEKNELLELWFDLKKSNFPIDLLAKFMAKQLVNDVWVCGIHVLMDHRLRNNDSGAILSHIAALRTDRNVRVNFDLQEIDLSLFSVESLESSPSNQNNTIDLIINMLADLGFRAEDLQLRPVEFGEVTPRDCREMVKQLSI